MLRNGWFGRSCELVGPTSVGPIFSSPGRLGRRKSAPPGRPACSRPPISGHEPRSHWQDGQGAERSHSPAEPAAPNEAILPPRRTNRNRLGVRNRRREECLAGIISNGEDAGCGPCRLGREIPARIRLEQIGDLRSPLVPPALLSAAPSGINRHGNPRRSPRSSTRWGRSWRSAGENPFRCRAYHNAAQALKGLPSDLSEMIADGTPRRGCRASARRCSPRSPSSPRPASFRPTRSCGRRRPRAWSRSCASRGSGRRRSRRCTTSSKIESLADLRAAAEAGQDRRAQGIRAEDRGEDPRRDRLPRLGRRPDLAEHGPAAGRADPRGRPRSIPAVIRAEVCGSLRRRAETIGDLDILFSADDPAPVLDRFVKLARGRQGAGPRADQGERPARRRRPVRPPGRRGRPVPVRAPLLHRLEGAQHRHAAAGARPRAHAERVRPRPGPTARSPARPRPTSSPRSAWPYIPPELREDTGEFEAAERGPLPPLGRRAAT